MTLSRRRFAAGLAVTLAAVGYGVVSAPRRVNVHDFGARGDGSTDSSESIRDAVSALRPGDTLYFPRGSYRFAQRNPAGGAAIVLSSISDVDIEFADGAELVMDNLDHGLGTGHAILVRGPASRITMRNIVIRWEGTAGRSRGDGIRVEGCPVVAASARWDSAPGPVHTVALENCSVQASPQAGVLMAGVAGISITGLHVRDTRADGLHFNACRNARITDYSAVDTGDDGVALVTYHSAQDSYDSASGTFSFPSLSSWSNAGFTLSGIAVSGGQANGLRLAGATDVQITGLAVSGIRSGAAVIADSAAPGADAGWHYVASRQIRLEQLAVADCETGIHVLARPGSSDDARFTDFDVAIRRADLRDCDNWSVRAESETTLPVTGLRADACSITTESTAGGAGGVGLANTEGIRFGSMSIRHAHSTLLLSVRDSRALELADARLEITDPETGTAAPCAEFSGSDGTIGHLQTVWPAAPASWVPVRIDTRSARFRPLHSRVAIREWARP